MNRTSPRALTLALAVTAPLLLGACSSSSNDQDDALPDINTSQAPADAADDFTTKPSVVGLMVSASEEEVVLKMPDGQNRTFQVRPEDAPSLGLGHLASHAGFTDVGFRLHYDTVDGVDYIAGAYETAPPQ
jgi:hypothetical protein